MFIIVDNLFIFYIPKTHDILKTSIMLMFLSQSNRKVFKNQVKGI